MKKPIKITAPFATAEDVAQIQGLSKKRFNELTKSKVPIYFSDWLTLMEEAYEALDDLEFTKLEDKIMKEIRRSQRKR